MPPATCPAASTTSSADEPLPRRSSSITVTGSGSPHQRDTDGSARIACSRWASPGRPGRSRTRRPASTGPSSSPSAAIQGSVPPPSPAGGTPAAVHTTLSAGRNTISRPPRPAPVADGRQRQQDPPDQKPQVPYPHVPAQRRPVHLAGGMDDIEQDKGAC